MEAQVAQFVKPKGVVDYVPEKRKTQWEITESGYIRWKPVVTRITERRLARK
jgi:hypothetical protein